MKHFDRLYKTIMEQTKKSSKKTVIKESVSIQEKMDAIRVAADIIKRAMAVNKDEVLEKLEEDVNYDSSCCAFEDYDGEGITREMWENSIKYGWMAETLPYFIDWHDDLFKDIEITPEERAILEKADNNAYVFSDEFEKGNLEGLDFCKEICSQFDVEIYPEELMIRFAGEDDDMDYESVKKPVSKRRVIKESARRYARRHLIKEWSYDDFIRVNKERIQKIFNRLFSNPETKSIYKQNLKKDVVREMKSSAHPDDPANPEETAAYVLEFYIYRLRWNKNIYALLTDEEKIWVDKYCDRFLEGQEGYVYDMYGGGSGYYEEICEMDPVYKEIVDEIVQEHGGPVTWAEQSVKKPVSKRRLIKEERMSKERREELYNLALDLFENYEWSSDEAQEAFLEDYPSFRRDFIDDYSNSSVSDEEFTKDFTGTMAYYNSDQYLEESKKADRRRQVIKESAKRPVKRHTRKLIKEDRLTQDQWLDMLQEKFDGVVKGLLEKYPNEVINSIDTNYFSSDPEDNACQILDGLFVYLIDRFPQNLLTERDKKWIGKYSDQWEGCEGLWSDYCWGGNDVGAYKCLREKFPVLADFVDKYVKEHPYEGTNANYLATDPRAKNPPFPTKAPVAESHKVSTRTQLIKESVRRHVRKIRK